jgi:uncharacterized membrane protein
MSHILVITFDDEKQAVSVLESLKNLEHKSLLSIKDAAVIVKDADGKVQIKNMVETGVKWGALGGSALGLLIGGLLFPVAGVLIGAAAGALIGKTFETGVDKKFIQEVRDSLTPSSSAILFIIGSENVDALIAVLEPYSGKIYHSSFDTGAEESIEKALK